MTMVEGTNPAGFSNRGHPESMRKGSKENANRSGLFLSLVSTAK